MADELYVLAINGGGDRMDNFASHLSHLQQLTRLLAATGVPRDHVVVLASDGQDPASDLATRAPEPEHAWLLQGTPVDPWLRDLLSFENSSLPGIALRPATRKSLTRTIAELRSRLHKGDTLLIYVTDHGSESRRDPIENRITLWGPRQSISVRGLGALLARLPREVRVVSLMSQCFSGGFAYLHEARERRRVPSGATCGYFSSTPDRPAYGCYPEVRGQKAVGHSFEFLSALARRGRFPAAHADILLDDDTPDIPLRSSDVYLAELLVRETPATQDEVSFVDALLRQATAAPAAAPESRLVERIAARYGVVRPATLAALDEQVQGLFALLDELEGRARTWEAVLGDFNRASLDGFLDNRPAWRERIQRRAASRLAPAARLARAQELLDELFPFVAADAARLAQAHRLINGLLTAEELSYRTEIRVAALLRARFVLTSLAGRYWLGQHPREASAFAALVRCEDLALPLPTALPLVARKPEPAKLPPLAEDQQRAASLRPGWLGITYVPVHRGRRQRQLLADGAALVTSILDGSPAAAAGLRRGDIVLGVPGRPFTHPNDLRPFIAAANPGASLPIEVQRGSGRIVITPMVGEAPVAEPR